MYLTNYIKVCYNKNKNNNMIKKTFRLHPYHQKVTLVVCPGKEFEEHLYNKYKIISSKLNRKFR